MRREMPLFAGFAQSVSELSKSVKVPKQGIKRHICSVIRSQNVVKMPVSYYSTECPWQTYDNFNMGNGGWQQGGKEWLVGNPHLSAETISPIEERVLRAALYAWRSV